MEIRFQQPSATNGANHPNKLLEKALKEIYLQHLYNQLFTIGSEKCKQANKTHFVCKQSNYTNYITGPHFNSTFNNYQTNYFKTVWIPLR